MNKGLLSLALALASVGMISAKGSSDPVLMTIKGKPVTLSEFEYLYHKNNSQQLTPQSIDEYLQMFITYKQKVADAEAEGIDKTEAFNNEYTTATAESSPSPICATKSLKTALSMWFMTA